MNDRTKATQQQKASNKKALPCGSAYIKEISKNY